MSGQTHTDDKAFVHIYTEANPNPNSMKFVLNTMLMDGSAIKDYPSVESAAGSPLALELFNKFAFVERVFFMSNFITITKKAETAWDEASPEIRAFLMDYFENRKPVFQESEAPEEDGINADDSEAVKKIKGVLDEYIKPAVETDGGAITFVDFNEESGVVKVQLQGACSGCPSSTITLKSGIENLLKRMVPGVQQVVAEGV